MKVLLINPSLRQATTGQYDEEVEKSRGVYMSLGLAYIAAVLEREGYEVKIIDCDVEENYKKKIEKIIGDFMPQVVGFYSMTWNYKLATKLVDKIKRIKPDIISVIGGPNVSCLPKESVEFGLFDFGVYGEGELTVVELFNKLAGKSDLAWDQILGLIFKKDGQIIINSPRPLIQDLDSIPFPARHLLPMDKYFDVFSRHRHFATILATRGCPFNCIFCDRKNRMGYNWRIRSAQNIAAEIRQVRNKYGIKEFMFFDDNLIVNKKQGLELCKELEKLDIIWECRNRVNLVDEELLRAMKKAGCYRIRFGFESGDNDILKVLKKGITVEESLATAELCKRIGIEVYGYFMIGSPTETPETIEKTINLALQIDPSFAIFSKTILIPGSELFGYGIQNGQIKSDYWRKYLLGEEINGAPAFSTPELPEELVDEYVKRADRRFYFRFKFILKKLLGIKSLGHLISQAKIGYALIFKTK